MNGWLLGYLIGAVVVVVVVVLLLLCSVVPAKSGVANIATHTQRMRGNCLIIIWLGGWSRVA